MSSTTMELRAPNGEAVTLRLPDDAPVSSVAAEVRFTGGAYSRGFQIGPRGYHAFACQHMITATQKDRFVVGGREVVVAATADGNTTLVTLLDRYHELMTVFTGPAPSRETLIGLFATIEIDDHPQGMRVVPAKATSADVVAQYLVVNVANRGKIGIPGARQAKALVPKHRGAATQHGEMWRLPLGGNPAAAGESDYLLIVAGPKGAAQVQLDQSGAMGTPELLTWAGGIDVSWRG